MPRPSPLVLASLVALSCLQAAVSLNEGSSGECTEYPCRKPWEKSTEGVYCPAGLADVITSAGDAALTHHAGKTDGSSGIVNTYGPDGEQTVAWNSPATECTSSGWEDHTHVESFNGPTAIAFKRHGLVAFIADTANNVIRSIKTRQHFTKTAAGSPDGTAGFQDGPGTSALFDAPEGVAIHPTEKFAYVADTNNHVIRYIDITLDSATVVSTAAGTVSFTAGSDCLGGCSGTAGQDDGTAFGTATFQSPKHIVFHPSGDYALIVDGTGSSFHIRKLGAGMVSTLTTGAARANAVNGIAFGLGGVFALFTEQNAIHRIEMSDSAVTTVMGVAGTAGTADGTGVAATFTSPAGIAVADTGTIAIVADGANLIRAVQMDLVGNDHVVTTIAGAGGADANDGNTSPEDGIGPLTTKFSQPKGVALAPAPAGGDALFALIADTGNNIIKKLDMCPTRGNAQCGPGYYTHRYGVTDGPNTFTWPEDGVVSTYTTQKYPICKKCRSECPTYWSYETTQCTSDTDRVCTGLGYKIRTTIQLQNDPTILDDQGEKDTFIAAVAASVTGEFERDSTPEIAISDVIHVPPRHLGRSQFSPWYILVEFDVYVDIHATARSIRDELWDLGDGTAAGTLSKELIDAGFTGAMEPFHEPRIMTNHHECRSADHRYGRTLNIGSDDFTTPVRNVTQCGSCMFGTDWDTNVYRRRNPSSVDPDVNGTIYIEGHPEPDKIPDGYYYIRSMSTFALNRSGTCPEDCHDVLDLSYPNHDILDIPKGAFDGLPNVRWLSLAGNGINGVPEGVFDGLAPNATIDLRCTNITCVPEVLDTQTLLLPPHLHPDDHCHLLDNSTFGPWCWGCDFFVNHDGLLSRGGQCRNTCQELDLRGQGIKALPYWPNGVFDSIQGLRLLHLDSDLWVRPQKHFAYEDVKNRILHIHQHPEKSWVFAGVHWFKQRLPAVYTLNQAMGLE